MRGYKNAAIDLGIAVKDLGVMLGTFIGESAAKTAIAIEKRSEEFKEADRDVAKKRLIVQEDPRYNRLSDEELKKIPASFLMMQAMEHAQTVSHQRLMELKDLPKPDISQNKVDDEAQRERILEKVKKILEKEYDRYSCYNPLAQEVQRILKNIQDGIRKDLAGPAHQVFREEKIVRAEKYREEARALAAQRLNGTLTAADRQALRQDMDELAKIQQPDISIGTTQVGSRDGLSDLLEKAESQAKIMKTDTVLNFGRSAEKYGSDATPRARPNPRYQGDIQKPLSSDSWTSSVGTGVPGDLDKLAAMKVERKEEVSRFGTTTLARYQDELGRQSYRVEKFYTDVEHLKSGPDTALLMPKLKSLRYLNYFESGTKAGDQMLDTVAKAIKSNTRGDDLNFKLAGAVPHVLEKKWMI